MCGCGGGCCGNACGCGCGWGCTNCVGGGCCSGSCGCGGCCGYGFNRYSYDVGPGWHGCGYIGGWPSGCGCGCGCGCGYC